MVFFVTRKKNKKRFKFGFSCFFSDEEWKKLDTVDPNKGIVFANFVSEKLSDKNSYYFINANYNQESKTKDEIEKVVYVEYYVNSMVTLRNEFNLKNFPFDKQKIEIFIFQNYETLDVWKSSVTDFTLKKSNEFMKINSIQG